jgi:hypothetical protein
MTLPHEFSPLQTGGDVSVATAYFKAPSSIAILKIIFILYLYDQINPINNKIYYNEKFTHNLRMSQEKIRS